MKIRKKKRKLKMLLQAVIFAVISSSVRIGAEALPPGEAVENTGILSSVTGEAQIYPIEDGTNQYLLKSDGYYCLKEDGTLDTNPGVHYFDHAEIDGVIFDGYYYHDASGKFKAGNHELVQIQQIACNKIIFDGFYMTGNLGKLSAASQVRYLENVTIGEVTFQGYYYFDINGRLTVEPNVAYLNMVVNGRVFDGNYYFGGVNGVLVEESGFTEEGIAVGADGKVVASEDLGMEELKLQLELMIAGYEGEWSIYVKDLGTDETISIRNEEMASASLIKVFMLAQTYQNYQDVIAHEMAKLALGSEEAAIEQIQNLMWKMITISDNESYNEIVRLQSEKNDFVDGAVISNEYLSGEGYENTKVQHTLHPSSSEEIGIGEDVSNMTSVNDCGLLMERIAEGTCVSAEASAQMLEYLKNQNNTSKIPSGLPEGILTANKTGETTQSEHDMAIVYGPKTTYVLCVMSQNWKNSDDAIDDIREISKVVYAYLNY